MPTKRQNLYTGRSGQHAVMSVFLFRGYNAAIPEVDVGDDIFVVRDSDGDLSRIQVKAAIAKGANRRRGRFHVKLIQLITVQRPELHYVFAFHYNELWRSFVVVSRFVLDSLYANQAVGRLDRDGTSVYFDISITDTTTVCNTVDLHVYRDNWATWPPIAH